MSKIGIFYGSTTGDTEELVMGLETNFSEYDLDLYNVNSASKADLDNYDKLIFASSTWGLGELQSDWEDFIETLKEADLSGKKVAFIGTGDQEMYSDTFVDAIAIIYEEIKGSGAEFVGQYSADSYDFSDSRALVDGKLIGLAIDNTNQSELTVKRLNEWSTNLF